FGRLENTAGEALPVKQSPHRPKLRGADALRLAPDARSARPERWRFHFIADRGGRLMFSTLFGTGTQAKRRSSPRPFVPRLEILEGRTLPSTFTVLNLADSGAGSLRDTILVAESNPGPDVINFASGLTGTITLTSGQFQITTDMTINGPGADQLTVSG